MKTTYKSTVQKRKIFARNAMIETLRNHGVEFIPSRVRHSAFNQTANYGYVIKHHSFSSFCYDIDEAISLGWTAVQHSFDES